jgi:hypothetical protein
MIAYLEKHDTTVELPDDIGQKDLQDINENFHRYVDTNPQPSQPAQPTSGQPESAQSQPTEPTPKWQPNFYESLIKPTLNAISPIIAPGIEAAVKAPGAEAFAGKAVEEGTFGAAKPLVEPLIAQDVKDHLAMAAAGQVAGGLGSLLVTGGALRIAGLGTEAALAGKGAVEAGFAAGERFIPRAIMTGATFGTRTFIAETVKAFQDGGIDLAHFGRDVLKDTAFGAMFGTIGGLSNAAASISSAGALGFISSKMDGADNREASLNGAIWAAFETVGSVGKTAELRLEALRNLKGSIGEYVAAREPGIAPERAQGVASQFVDNAVRKAGFENAEDLAKSGPENLLEGIEKVNQAVRTARVPAEAEAKPEAPKMLEAGETPQPGEPKPEDLTAFAKQHPAASETDLAQMAYNRGLLEEPNADLLRMQMEPTSSQKQALYESDLEKYQVWRDLIGKGVRAPDVEDKGEYKSLPLWMRNKAGRPYDEISQQAEEMGLIRPGEDIWSTLRDVRKPTANYSLAPDAKEPVTTRYERLVKQASDQGLNQGQAQKWAISQMTQKVEPISTENKPVQKEMGAEGGVKSFGRGKQGESELNFSMAGSAPSPRATIPKESVAPITPEAVSSKLKESSDEIVNLVNPTKAAPLAAQITRETLGKMARSYDMAEASLADASKLFNSQSKEANLAFIDNMERGQGQKDANLDVISSTLRKLLDDKRKEIQALGTGKMQSFIENYFPHIWDQGEKQVSQAVMKGAKRPFEGSKGFLKKRSIEFTSDGIAAGLTPVSYNPVDLALLKIREMDKYLAAHRTIKEYKSNGLAKYVKIGGEVPDGWQKIDDKISTVFKSPMVAVKEAYDEKMMNDLNAVGKALGVDLERSERIKGEGRKFPGELWGLSQSSGEEGKPGKVSTKFAGPESVLAHELGHQLDHMYGLSDKFLSDPNIDEELTALAKERLTDKSTKAFKKYVQEPSEKIAGLVEAFIHAPELLKETAPMAFKDLVRFLTKDPKLAPLAEIRPSMQLGINKGEVYAGGAVIAGHIYAQPDAARIINNYLSPGLQKSAIYQTYRYAGNLINQFQLGFSAFHLGFTSLDATVSKFALALNELAAGHPIKATEKALAAPFAPVSNIIRGNELLKAWKGEGKTGIDNILANAMAFAGGRARMDQFYATKAYDQMKHHFEAGNVVRGLLHIPLSIAEISSKPILEYIVPRQKLGVFSDMMKMEMENNPNMTHDQMREIAQRAWDSVDNRMGQLVYDNLFWNRTFKDLLMGSVRSVGWNLGTIRELAGGAVDYVEAVKDAASGKKPEFSYRMAYFAALPIVTGILGAMIQYLRTGKGPQEMKDYWFPRTGGVDANGEPARMSLPSYMKDLYHYTQAPIKTITNKVNPIISIVAQMLENKDYFGTKIRNEDDPLVKQVASEASYMLRQSMPFSIRNMQRNQETGNKSLFDTIGPWVGITPAPYDINQTKAEKLAHEIAASHQTIGGRTEAEANRSRLMGQLARQYKAGDPKAQENIYKAYQSGQISRTQMRNVIVHSSMTPIQRMVHGMSLEEIERVYTKSDEDEKAQIENVLRRKEMNQQRQFVQTGAE